MTRPRAAALLSLLLVVCGASTAAAQTRPPGQLWLGLDELAKIAYLRGFSDAITIIQQVAPDDWGGDGHPIALREMNPRTYGMQTIIRLMDRLYEDPANANISFALAMKYGTLVLAGVPPESIEAALAEFRRISLDP